MTENDLSAIEPADSDILSGLKQLDEALGVLDGTVFKKMGTHQKTATVAENIRRADSMSNKIGDGLDDPGEKSLQLEDSQDSRDADSNLLDASIMGEAEDSSSAGEPSFNVRLIEAVKECRCLFDSSNPHYRDADYKIEVWNNLVQTLEYAGDARMLYNRWKQLRDKYGKEKKKAKLGIYGNGLPQWQYYKYLEWLDPYMVNRTQQRFERAMDGTLVYKEPPRPFIIADPDFMISLVEQVRQHPCLYDVKDPLYRNTEHRNNTWSDIISRLNFPGDMVAIYKEWKKIRDRYVREKRKLRMSANGNQDGSSWDLFPDLVWIDPHLEERAVQIKRRRENSELSNNDVFLSESFNSSTAGTSEASESSVLQKQAHIGCQQQDGFAAHNNNNHNGFPPKEMKNRIRRLLPISPTSTMPRAASIANGDANTLAQRANPSSIHPHRPPQPLFDGIHRQPQQQLIITNEPLTGDRAFALSVAADLASLPEQARAMARAQIQYMLEHSKITIIRT